MKIEQIPCFLVFSEDNSNNLGLILFKESSQDLAIEMVPTKDSGRSTVKYLLQNGFLTEKERRRVLSEIDASALIDSVPTGTEIIICGEYLDTVMKKIRELICEYTGLSTREYKSITQRAEETEDGPRIHNLN